jgi:hypothetical protein
MTQKTSQDSGAAAVKPLVVRPRIARQLLGGMCEESLWRLINDGTLESFMQGRARLITMESIEQHINRQLAAAQAAPQAHENPTTHAVAARQAKRAAATSPKGA